MRIISGKFRGTKLTSPPDGNIRPTTDRVKETMFGSIQFDLQGAVVLDLFSGSGALGIEAVSRGAAEAVLVDSSSAAIEVIKSNLALIKNPKEIKLIKNDYSSAIKQFQNSKKFDIVLVDPPYSAEVYEKTLNMLVENSLLNNNAIIILESDQQLVFEIEGIGLLKKKKVGITYLTYCRYCEMNG